MRNGRIGLVIGMLALLCAVCTLEEDIGTLRKKAASAAIPPVISGQPQGGTYTQGAETALTVTATASDGGALTYQWYSNTANTNSGGTKISGATGESYIPPTSAAGTRYYYVIVTNPRNKASVTSIAAAITVNTLTNAATPVISSQPQGAIGNSPFFGEGNRVKIGGKIPSIGGSTNDRTSDSS